MSTEESASRAPPALPSPTDADVTQEVLVSDEQMTSLKFDALGPLVVNCDGVSFGDLLALLCIDSLGQ